MSLDLIDFEDVGLAEEAKIKHLGQTLRDIKKEGEVFVELGLLVGFYKQIETFSKNFLNAIFKSCITFQNDISQKIQNDQISHYLQTLMNNFLRYHQMLEKKVDNLSCEIQRMDSLKENFQSQVRNNLKNSEEKFQLIQDQLEQYRMEYITYIQNSIMFDQKKKKEGTQNIPLFDQEEKSMHLFESVLVNCDDIYQDINKNLDNFAQQEEVLKEAMKSSIIIISDVFSSENQEFIDNQLENLEQNMDKFNSEFKKIKSKFEINFHYTPFKKIGSFFLNDKMYRKKAVVCSLNYQIYLKKKFTEFEQISQKQYIYSEEFIRHIYFYNIPLSQDEFQQLNQMFKKNLYYFYNFVYKLLYKKAVLFLQKPFVKLDLQEFQQQNFLALLQIILEYLNNFSDQNIELIYNILKIIHNINTFKQLPLVSLFRDFDLFKNPALWEKLYLFAQKNKNSNSIFNQFLTLQKKKKIDKTLSNLFNRKNFNIDYDVLCFQEVINLVILFQFSFQNTKNILIKLVEVTHLNQLQIKNSLLKWESNFHLQIKQTDKIYKPYSKLLIKKQNFSKNQKLFLIMKKIFPFLDKFSDIFNFSFLNKYFVEKRQIFYKKMLIHNQTNNKDFRKRIYHQIAEKLMKTFILQEIKESETLTVISLDVKRTMSYDAKFNTAGLELILRNISSHKVGNFSYYQGLNYLTNYFYILFDGHQIKTYNFVIFLMNNYFQEYVDKDLQNMKILFFYINTLIQIYLPKLYLHLQKLNLNMDIIFASWCLTLFTQILHLQKQNQILDDIIDIFVSKGWEGFFRVILVLLEEAQEKICQNDFDQNLLFFSDLTKCGFSIINSEWDEERCNFSIKEKLKKYRKIDQYQIMLLREEFESVQVFYKEFLSELESNLSKKSKNS